MAMKQEGEMYALLARQSINKRYFIYLKSNIWKSSIEVLSREKF